MSRNRWFPPTVLLAALLVASLVASLIALTPRPAAAAMGSAAGSFSVNQGSASYTVQLAVPPACPLSKPRMTLARSTIHSLRVCILAGL